MADLKNPRWMYAKAVGFVIIGLLASFILWLNTPHWQTIALLALAVWAFARAYYFAFYVIEHYIDPGYRFAGLWSVIQYLWKQRSKRK